VSLFEYLKDFYRDSLEGIGESKPTYFIGEFGIVRHERQSVRLERFREPQGSCAGNNEWLHYTGERGDIESTSAVVRIDERS